MLYILVVAFYCLSVYTVFFKGSLSTWKMARKLLLLLLILRNLYELSLQRILFIFNSNNTLF